MSVIRAHVKCLELEIQRLQAALAFWLPHRPARELPADLTERLEHDIGLLAGYMGKMEKDAEELGWISLTHAVGVSDGG